MQFLESIVNMLGGGTARRFKSHVDAINAREEELQKLTPEALREKNTELKERVEDGESLESILPEAFALVREASRRTLGMRHFDVQIMGGAVLHAGKIAEMRTGEGKTLVATLAACLNALEEKGVHVVTVNDYLAKRDAVWMGQIYHALGLSVGVIMHDASYLYDPTYRRGEEHDAERDATGNFKVVDEFLRPVSRKEAYAAHVTYGTNNEFGFDYLRDNMAQSRAGVVQRPHHFAIVDEIDSILIDEARTPLIISMPDRDSSKLYSEFARLATRLVGDVDYAVDEKMRAVTLTADGITKVERLLGIANMYDVNSLEGSARGLTYLHHLEQALKARILYKRDKDYVVKENEVIIIDEFTGRLLPGRRYSEGLHQAIEAKEGVYVQRESKTLASITFQNYFRLYKKLSGMTGTAKSSEEEFYKVYGLEVVQVPTNKAMIRADLPDLIFKTEDAKWHAVVKEIKRRNEVGQPVLVGTLSIDKNEHLGALLKREGVSFEMLNAKNHEREGMIIAQAGRARAVTIATNMAGRGVDIILGGNPPTPEEAEKVRSLGGLHVIGTDRHDARRIDDQLRGRAGRQGDPGSSQFFVSLDGDLMRVFGGSRIKGLMETFNIPDDMPIENAMVSRALGAAQAKIEGYNFDIRKHVLDFDEVMNRHRSTVYRMRRDILVSSEEQIEVFRERVLETIHEELGRLLQAHLTRDEWDIKEVAEDVKTMFGLDLASVLEDKQDPEEIRELIVARVDDLMKKKEEELGKEAFLTAAKALYLQIIDMAWMNHLENMEYLRDSVRLRAWGQRDPLVEYKNEGHAVFKELIQNVNLEFIANIMKLTGSGSHTHASGRPHNPAPQIILGPPLSENKQTSIDSDKTGRNDPCPCGSGKKYKKCHGV